MPSRIYRDERKEDEEKGRNERKKEERVGRQRKELNHSSTREKSNCGKVCNLNPEARPVFTIVLVGY